MGKYRNKETGKIVEAFQWFKNGDHPLDDCTFSETGELSEGKIVGYFPFTFTGRNSICHTCRFPYEKHGWANAGMFGFRICPGDMVVTEVDTTIDGITKTIYFPRRPFEFFAEYEEIEDR